MIRAAVLYFSRSSSLSRVRAVAEGLAQGLRGQGAQVDLINGLQARDTKLTGYHYLAVGCDVRSLFQGRLPAELGPSLANGGIVSGKKAFAFVLPSLLGSAKTLMRLMKALEHEGIIVRYSELLARPADAAALGRQLKLG